LDASGVGRSGLRLSPNRGRARGRRIESSVGSRRRIERRLSGTCCSPRWLSRGALAVPDGCVMSAAPGATYMERAWAACECCRRPTTVVDSLRRAVACVAARVRWCPQVRVTSRGRVGEEKGSMCELGCGWRRMPAISDREGVVSQGCACVQCVCARRRLSSRRRRKCLSCGGCVCPACFVCRREETVCRAWAEGEGYEQVCEVAVLPNRERVWWCVLHRMTGCVPRSPPSLSP
jgi:hypothetical protein